MPTRDQATAGLGIIDDLPIIGETRSLELFREAGFGDALPCFRGLWYAAWLCKAV